MDRTEEKRIDYEAIQRFPHPWPIPDPVPWWRIIEKLQGDQLKKLAIKQLDIQVSVMEKQIELMHECRDVMKDARF